MKFPNFFAARAPTKKGKKIKLTNFWLKKICKNLIISKLEGLTKTNQEMKTLKSMGLMSLLLLFMSCGDGREEQAEEVVTSEVEMENADEVMTDWRNAWNNSDPDALQELTGNDAVLLLNGREVAKDSIMAWYRNSTQMVRELETNSTVQNSGEDIAYEAGTYTHAMPEDSNVQVQGTYTVVWERENDEWKVRLMNISPSEEADSIIQQYQQQRQQQMQ